MGSQVRVLYCPPYRTSSEVRFFFALKQLFNKIHTAFLNLFHNFDFTLKHVFNIFEASFMPEIRQWHDSNVAPAWHLFSAKCGADLLRGALLARFVLIMRINAQRHIDRRMSGEVLNLLNV